MVTILTAHQPLYLPWLGFFHKVAMSDIFCLWEDVQFSPKDFMHRNRIKNPNGGAMWITVPILTKGYREKTINDMYIDNTKNWRRVHWNSILVSYSKKAPYFESYSDFFETAYKKNWDKIADLDEYLLKYLLKELGISVKFVKASEQNFKGEKSDRVSDMCVKLGADAYIFGELGKDYANVEDFEKKEVKVYFQNYKHPVYPQLYGEFVSHLSIIDLLFCYGEKSYDILMKKNPTRGDLIKILGL
jgi:hypothetical protein